MSSILFSTVEGLRGYVAGSQKGDSGIRTEENVESVKKDAAVKTMQEMDNSSRTRAQPNAWAMMLHEGSAPNLCQPEED